MVKAMLLQCIVKMYWVYQTVAYTVPYIYGCRPGFTNRVCGHHNTHRHISLVPTMSNKFKTKFSLRYGVGQSKIKRVKVHIHMTQNNATTILPYHPETLQEVGPTRSKTLGLPGLRSRSQTYKVQKVIILVTGPNMD